jgi:hypothetical protein
MDRQESTLASPEPAGPTPGRSDDPAEGGTPDVDLAALVAAWPTLPEPIRVAIRVVVGSVAGSCSPGGLSAWSSKGIPELPPLFRAGRRAG